MSSESASTRDRVRALVREILDSVPAEEPPVSPDRNPEHVVVNSLREKAEREYDRDESSKSLITEDDLRGLDAGSRVRVSENAKFTPLASDIVNDKQIVLIRKKPRVDGLKVKSAAVAADHGGYEMKEQLKVFLEQLGIQVRDFGTNSKDAVDYPDFAHAAGRAVAAGHVDVGIIIDGAGIGSAMAANKVSGVRAAACYSPALARNSREHNGANVLTLGSGQSSLAEVQEIVRAFVTTEISEERHKRRVAKIDAIEREYKRP
ncbi:MAG TPA: RpiB/LacA/LacB family sugar-phosphate isomerase [Pyrinomonadaceae bacterium]|nr:RpiB/LacA/LacB family sugar-phosphate isomerase [Pyrinomonadaceae bacterium]